MTKTTLAQAWRRLKWWHDWLFGKAVAVPDDEQGRSPEYVQGWQDGYLAGDASHERLLRVIKRLARRPRA